MKKLSVQFLELSQHTAALEDQAARAKNRNEFEAHVAEACARANSFRESFRTRLEKLDESMPAPWTELDESLAAYLTLVQRNLDASANARDLASARECADDAETRAEIAAEFARVTATEAEMAMVEAKQARAAAQSMEKALS